MTFRYMATKGPKHAGRSYVARNGYGRNWPSQRRKALERDNYTCQKCGHKGIKHGNRWDVHVHHRRKIAMFYDPISGQLDYEAANDLDNLITLCDLGCHKYADGHENKSGFVQLR